VKIYTGTGDRGKTSLFSGERISKNDIRIDAYGDIDELNSIIGALIASLPQNEKKRSLRSYSKSSPIYFRSAPGSLQVRIPLPQIRWKKSATHKSHF
jgi:hypothetical protein